MAERPSDARASRRTPRCERVQARVNLAAIERNCARLRAELRARRAAVRGRQGRRLRPRRGRERPRGARRRRELARRRRRAARLRELREAGLERADPRDGRAHPRPSSREALAAGGDVVVWSERCVRGGRRGRRRARARQARLRHGPPRHARPRSRRRACRRGRAAPPGVELAGLMTHFATADELDDDGFFDAQLDAFARWARAAQGRARPELLVHAANSAAVLRDAGAHFDMVRCGIASTAWTRSARTRLARGLEPALELRSYVAEVKPCGAGESAGYGRRFIAERDTDRRAADRLRRRLAARPLEQRRGADRRAPPPARRHRQHGQRHRRPRRRRGRGAAAAASAAVLIGSQGSERITAEELARASDTINYEITCGLTPRVPRVYHRDGAAEAPATATGAPHGRARRRERRPEAARAALAGSRAWLVGGRRARRAARARDRRPRPRRRRRPGRAPRGRSRAPAGRAACFALSEEFGAWRVVARDGTLAGRRRAAARRHARGRPRAARLHRQRDRRAARGRRADRPARRRRRTCARGACGWPGPGAFADDPLRVLRLVRVAVELGLEPDAGHAAPARASTPRAAPVSRPSACSPSCAGSLAAPAARARASS